MYDLKSCMIDYLTIKCKLNNSINNYYVSGYPIVSNQKYFNS